MAVSIGPSGISPWHNEEIRVALEKRSADWWCRYRPIPALLPGANPADPRARPRFLRRLTWVDFRGGLDEDAFRCLMTPASGVKRQGANGCVPGSKKGAGMDYSRSHQYKCRGEQRKGRD